MVTYGKNQLYQMPPAELQPDHGKPSKYMDPVATPFHQRSGVFFVQ